MGEHMDPASPPASEQGPKEQPDSVQLILNVTDPELVAELVARPEGEPRTAFALSALRIGILTLKQAQGRLDAETIKHESDRLLLELGHALKAHQQTVTNVVADSLQEYFDPKSGRFNERINRLIAKDGDLEILLRQQIGLDDSQLAKTLAAHLGENSPIMRRLSPEDSDGFLNLLTKVVNGALLAQREAILAEFSLDKEESALSRLVKRVETSQGKITSEFSLDDENSALARLKRELLEVLGQHKRAADEFHTDVSEKLAAMTARREEALRSTRHGEDFEEEVRRFVAAECQKVGDIPKDTSNTVGLIKNCKVGDVVIELGPESSAPGVKIAVEAKESGGYTLAKALEELETARKNRGADVGLFVFSRRTAPAEQNPMARYGKSIVAVWDFEDPRTDVCLTAGLSVARAICTQEDAARRGAEIDFEPAEKAIRAIEKLSGGLEEIKAAGTTIQSGSQKILIRVGIMERELHRQVSALDATVGDLKSALPSSETE
ncbi:MAG TPA: hypothetical protein VM219_04895 [Phycisphaerae bacterium]|nr:hypothetical protein [Phycisphaerae bacterium]